MPAGDVNNAQPPMAQVGKIVRIITIVVGPSVRDDLRHALQNRAQRWLGMGSGLPDHKSGDATHKNQFSGFAARAQAVPQKSYKFRFRKLIM